MTKEKEMKKEKKMDKLYSKPIVINSEIHKDIKIAPVTNYKFAKYLNSSILTGFEFFEAAKYYPIVFSKTSNEEIMPIAILGLTENVFIDKNGKWKDEFYIPAFIRRYPYILSKTNDNDENLLVTIDSAYEGFDAKEGDRLFDDSGNNTPALNRAIEFLKAYDEQFKITKQFIEKITSLELLIEVNANIKLADGENYVMNNILVIDEAKMLKLEDKELLGLIKLNGQRGFIAWIYAHIFSINNFAKIIKK